MMRDFIDARFYYSRATKRGIAGFKNEKLTDLQVGSKGEREYRFL